MKLNYLLLVLCFPAVISCSGEETPEDKSETNLAPSVPDLIYPSQLLQCTYSSLTFEWKASVDPEGETVEYTLEFSKTPDFQKLALFRRVSTPSAEVQLQPGTLYYWRVKAGDKKLMYSDYSEVRTLSTEPQLEYNNAPYPAQIEAPADFAQVDQETLLLTWKAEDKDGDNLTYDLYFGKTDPPGIFQEGLEENSLEVNLEKGTIYYWKVNTRDGKGAKSIGTTWRFTRK